MKIGKAKNQGKPGETIAVDLNGKIERAFWEAGKALQEISDRKLYRASHKTFENYCKDRLF